jgi:hypothetical protein
VYDSVPPLSELSRASGSNAAAPPDPAYLDKFKAKNISPQKITLQQFISKYLAEHEWTHNRISTVIKDEGICRNHIIPELGDRRLQDITTQDLHLFRNNLVKYKSHR